MNRLPIYLQLFLSHHNYNFCEVLQYNYRKNLYVLKIEKDKSFFLLKSYDIDNSLDTVKTKFKTEQGFYRNNSSSSIPKLIYFEKNIIILEYIDSLSLREYLIKREDKRKLLVSLFSSLDKFKATLIDKDSMKNDFSNVYRYISVLCNSHPFQAKNIQISFWDISLNRIIYKLLLLKIKRILQQYDNKNLLNGFSHHDFHYNNILVSPNDEIKFIDFENIKYSGYFDFDVLFLLVLIDIYIEQSTEEYRILKNYLEALFLKDEVLKQVYEVYKIAVSINKKFFLESNKKSLSKSKKIILIMRLLKGNKKDV